MFAHRLRRRIVWVVACMLVLFGLPFGSTAPAAAAGGGWSTNGVKILDPTGTEFIISGVNWFGFETRDAVAHGLWAQDYKFLLNKIKQYGFNTVRLPYSDEMWRTNPVPRAGACAECKNKHSRDIMALILNYGGSIGLHFILDNHRSNAGNSAQENGLWYLVAGSSNYPESVWIADWLSIQSWLHGNQQTLGSVDTVTVNYLGSDGFPVVIGFDLRNEPHTPSRKAYLEGATWGTGDGIDPNVNPNPNPFAPACIANSVCHDWRLGAERAADTILGDASGRGWDLPLIFVEGIGQYPASGGTAANGPYNGTWWGGDLEGVNGNSTNPGAPVVLNVGGNATALGPAVTNKLVYSAHEYGPNLFKQSWFNPNTCYTAGCGASSLADTWRKFWAYINLPGGVNPLWPGHAAYPWANTGHTAYTQAPIYMGEFGTENTDADLSSTTRGSQGQWFTDAVNFVQSSYTRTASNDSGLAVTSLHWTYWALNANTTTGLLGSDWASLASSRKEYSFLCVIQRGPLAVPPGPGPGQCGSTGPLPAPF
jgi:endoglucanase